MAEIKIKNETGKEIGTHKLKLAEISPKSDSLRALLHQAVVTEQANARQGTQKTKTRSETRGGGRKPYRQKKTGRARQGTIRAPHYAHGGMALALAPRDYSIKLNKKQKRQALIAAFVTRVNSGDVIIAETIAFTEPRLKHATKLLKDFGLASERRILVILAKYDKTTHLCFRNLPNVEVRTVPMSATEENEPVQSAGFSVRDIMVAHKILVDKNAMDYLEEYWSK
jgi:large subunit ribosomal protein L4